MSTVAATPDQRGIDTDEVNRFVDEEYSRVVAAVALITGDRASAEDTVQDAMVKAWQRRREIENLAAWITVVASNAANSGLRRRANEKRAVERLERLLETVRHEPIAERLTMGDAVAALPRRQRQVVVLHYYLGFPVADCAATLGVHEGTVKTSLHRARQALGLLLGETDDPQEDGDGS